MPPFRFNIPFFSYGSPSRLSSGTSSQSPPPTPPSRPPFRPAGIAQPSKPAATSTETKSKVPSSLSRAKSNVAAIVASLSGSQSPSRTPTRLVKLSNSPLQKPESLRTVEQNRTMKEKPSVKEAGENINPVIERPPTARLERREAEVEKLAPQEKKKVNFKGIEGKSETAQGQQKIKETESNQQSGSLISNPEQKATMKEKPSREIEREPSKNINPVIEKPPRKEAEAAPEQRSKTETQKLVEQERMKALNEGSGQKKKETEKKLAVQETKKDLQADDATRHITAASEFTRGPKDLLERKTQNRTETHAGYNQQKAKGVTTVNHGVGTSSMSKRIKEDISKLTWGQSNGDERFVSVYTLTGENKGAIMAIASEKDKKDGEVHIRRGYRSNPNESPNTTSTESEGERKPCKDRNLKDDDEEEPRFSAYVNGNTQGINNSIVLESSVRENDPGIHMSVEFKKSRNEIINLSDNVPEKKPELKNEPRVRRRCLRGLLAESSESENPLKPRRHGCRFTCKDKDIEDT